MTYPPVGPVASCLEDECGHQRARRGESSSSCPRNTSEKHQAYGEGLAREESRANLSARPTIVGARAGSSALTRAGLVAPEAWHVGIWWKFSA